MKRRWAPGQIDLLIHCYATVAAYPYLGAPATTDWINQFLEEGILVPDTRPHVYRVTDKGTAWLFMMLSTPYPEQKSIWFDPRSGRPIEDLPLDEEAMRVQWNKMMEDV